MKFCLLKRRILRISEYIIEVNRRKKNNLKKLNKLNIQWKMWTKERWMFEYFAFLKNTIFKFKIFYSLTQLVL